MNYLLITLTLWVAGVLAADPQTCCYKQTLDFEALEQLLPVAETIIPQDDFETKSIRFKSFGFSYKQPGLSSSIDPRGTNYAYYGLTTTTTGTGYPGLTLNYQGADLKSFTITKFAAACAFIVPTPLLAQLKCDVTMRAYKDGTNKAGEETYTFYTSLGLQQAMFDQNVNLKNFTSTDWTTVNFETAYSVKLIGSDKFISLSDATSKLGLKSLTPFTYLDSIEMTVSPKVCANCLA